MAFSRGDERVPREIGTDLGDLPGADPAPDHALVRRLKAGGRWIVEGLERRRAHGVRRHPEPLAGCLRGARDVLILCQGNVIRSVFAAHLMSAALEGRRPVSIRSAGLETVPGWPAHPYVRARCEALQIDLGGHASKAVTAAMVEAADLVLVMEVSQLAVVWRRFPGARRKTFLLSGLAPDVPLEIRDPAGKDEAALEACLDHITRALKPVIELITAVRPLGPAMRDTK
jgi:low molecular weight protein-tyrosine phosphatase